MTDKRFESYLQYLDKEMTIMGILSGFCLASVAFGLDAILSVDKQHQLGWRVWEQGGCLFLTGATLLLAAAYLFYEQRSCLAWHYGTIAYLIAGGEEGEALASLEDLQNSRAEWKHYFFAHGAMILAFAALLLALCSTMVDWIKEIRLPLSMGLSILTMVWVLVVFIRQRIGGQKRRRALRQAKNLGNGRPTRASRGHLGSRPSVR
jgi:hypothetical protein